MQLFEHTMAILRDTNNITTIPASSHIEMKEKRSSNASLMMNPVASGDNMALDINLAQKIEELPPLVPCCEGRELQHRNSFRSLHRPDLKRVPYLRRMTPDELETLFRGYAEFHLKTSLKIRNDPKEDVTQTLPPDEKLKKEVKEAPTIGQNDAVVHSSVARRGAEDVPAGKRLHGARARLYTSVLASATPGDQLDNASAPDEYDSTVPDEPLPEDDIILNEELQIILPPRPDDVTADPSLTASMQNQ
ncbi:uncharacterized protein LOC123705648 isoform X4 [Colias croceus]|uniref:uncharacterized protein LOC123705648 isoform X4 n=1 Tax=Colias crocea TaxID=72248 RepID=UPI001E27D280|nr:uncharacterized protein LOC123705648 isoform X4 [Colias croceus]